VRCAEAKQPPPFRFAAVTANLAHAPAGPAVLRIPLMGITLLLAGVGRLIDVAFFLAGLTVWCSIHIVLWSYAYQMGPAADCFGLPCPGWLASKVVLGLGVLAVLSLITSRILKRLGHRATSLVLVLLVTFDVAGLMVLGIGKLT